MRVTDILRHKGNDVATIEPDATIETASRRLAERGIGALIVSADGSSVLGIVSERDIVAHLATVGRDGVDTTVLDVMTREVHTCVPSDSLEDLARTMTESRVRHIPVVEGGRLGGIISIGDVVKRRLVELEHEREQMQTYIQTGR